jgi:hypothetical protein
MNMAEEDMRISLAEAPIFCSPVTILSKADSDPVSRARGRRSFQRGRSDDARPAELNGVEDVNFQRKVVISYQLSVIT